MAYQYITSYNSKNFTTAADCPSIFREPRTISAITIHHWGEPNTGLSFDVTCDYLCTNDNPTSAHYVVSGENGGKVACLVDCANVSFACGNAHGNASTISLELRPEATADDYRVAAELIKELRDTYGDLPLLPHNHWFNTACPGNYDLNHLDALARGITGSTPKPAPAPAPALKPAAPAVVLYNRIVTNAVANARVAPNNGAAVAVQVAQGATLAVRGYVSGQDPYGTGDNAWYLTKSGYYVWANAASNDISNLPYFGAR